MSVTKKTKDIELNKIRGLMRDSEEAQNVVPDLIAEGYGVFTSHEEDKSALIDLATSDSTDDLATYVELVDEFAPHVAVEAAAILQRGMTPISVSERRISTRLVSGYTLNSGLLTVLAQFYNHCKTGMPARAKGTID